MSSNVWLSPPEVVRALGPFDLDPAAAPSPRPWPTARVHYTEAQGDGLARPWFGMVWLNPPYRPTPLPWMERLADHGRGVGLVFARTGSPWWFSSVWHRATGALFLRGHLHFYHADGTRAAGNAGGDSALLGFGDEASRRLVSSGLNGRFVPFSAVVLVQPDGTPAGTWKEAVAAAMAGRVLHISAVYAAAEGTVKVREAKERRHNWRAQVRRTLQFHFRPAGRAQWRPA